MCTWLVRSRRAGVRAGGAPSPGPLLAGDLAPVGDGGLVAGGGTQAKIRRMLPVIRWTGRRWAEARLPGPARSAMYNLHASRRPICGQRRPPWVDRRRITGPKHLRYTHLTGYVPRI